MSDKGPNDLEETISKLKKQIEFLQGKCRQAGEAILDQEVIIGGLKKKIDRLAEENSNLELLAKEEVHAQCGVCDSQGEIDAEQRNDLYVDADGIHRLQ